jgi:predicted metal-dependent enzyme (double-stranded beta helix superfamily)
MKGRDWFVTDDGQYQACQSVRPWELLRENYRLHRFLTEVEDVLNSVEDETSQLPDIRMLVRRLIVNSYWVQSRYLEPSTKTGTSILLLYDELGFPFTVQTVTFAPGTVSTIHNHGTWGVVAVLKGEEKNTFWQRIPHPEYKDKIDRTGELTLFPGDIISFTPDAIHSVEAVGDKPTVTFNIYGETHMRERFEYDTASFTAKNF